MPEEIGHALTNKWVLFGGVALAAVLFIASRSGASASGSGASYDPTAAIIAGNQQAGQNYAVSVSAATQLGLARYSRDATIAQAVTGTIQNMENVSGLVEAAQIQSNAGIINSVLTTNAAVAQDFANNQARIAEIGISSNASQEIAAQQASAQKAVAHANMWSNLGSSLFGALGKIL